MSADDKQPDNEFIEPTMASRASDPGFADGWLNVTLNARGIRLTSDLENTGTDRTPAPQEPRARLIALMGNAPGRMYPIDDEVYVGRDPKCAVWTPELDISRKHARIYHDEGNAYVVEDLGSKNGTLVNGVAVDRKVLGFGDRIQLGTNTSFLFSQNDQLQDQLLQAQKMEAMGRLAASVVHDFGNLLTSILGHVGLLESNDHAMSDEQIRSAVDGTRAAALRGSELIQQLLRFVRHKESEPDVVDVTNVVRDAAQILRPTIRGAITVDLELADQLEIVGDKTHIHQLVLNLLTNARDAMPDGGELRVTLRETRRKSAKLSTLPALPPGAYIVLSVADTGIGMDAATQRRLFEPFFTTKAPEQGTGLGLAAAYGIVRAHGGGVEVQSTVGEGSEIKVYLPKPQPTK